MKTKCRGKKKNGSSPSPGLLGLEQYRNSGIVEPGKEGKIDNVFDVFIYTCGKIEDETGGIRHVPVPR